MTAYLLVYLAPLLGVLSPLRAGRVLRTILWISIGIGLIVFIGLRHEVGMDWPAYLSQFNQQVDSDVGPLWINEPLYVLMSWWLAQRGFGLHLVNTICAGVFVFGLLVFASRQPLRWLALAVAVPYLVIIVGLNNTRQSVALGLLFLGLLILEKGRIKTFASLMILAAMFHASALACLLFAALKVPRGHGKHFLVMLAVALSLGVGYLSQSYEAYARFYGVDTQLQSSGAGVRLAINILAFGVMLALRRSWEKRFGWDKLWFWMGMFSLFLLPLLPITSTAVDRMALYLMPLQMYVWGRAPLLIATPLWRTVAILGVITLYAAVLCVWLAYATNSMAWFPYQNLLMEVPK